MSVTAVRSVASNARRDQIVAATIDVIAEVGYARASFARIAEHASLSSTRLISYHFAGREDLMAAVAEHVINSISDYMTQRMQGQQTATAMLRAYIEGTVEFIASHRAHMKALMAIFLAGAMLYDASDEEQVVSHVENILREGQTTGEFRDFDVTVMGTVVQRAVDGLPMLLDLRPDLDCAAYGRELVTMFDLATRREQR